MPEPPAPEPGVAEPPTDVAAISGTKIRKGEIDNEGNKK